MPKNLTDVSQWPVVAVPVGTDPATAASVETTFQILADRSSLLKEYLLSLRASNWSLGDVSDIGGGTFCSSANVKAVCYDPEQDRFWAIDDDGAVVYTLIPNYGTPPASLSGGPHRWNDDPSDPKDNTLFGASGTDVDIAADSGGPIVAVSDSAVDQIARSSGVAGAWSAQSPAVAGISWTQVTFDPGASLFIAAGRYSTAARVETSPDGTTWTNRSTEAGFTVTAATPGAIASDPAGNGGTMILTQTEYAHTLNGTSYTQDLHGLGSVPLALTYSDGRWVAVLTSGDVAYSDDDGASWSTVSTPLNGFVANYVHIDADGVGGLVASSSNATKSILWASTDNGLTWTPVYHSAMVDAMESGPCFGGGHFAAIGCLSGGTVAAMHSLRVFEI